MACTHTHPTPSGLSVGTAALGSTTKISLSGELDLAAQPAVHRTLDAVFALGPEEVVLDLSRLTFMDSTGVHLAAAAAARARASAPRTGLTLIPGPASIQRVFAIAGAMDRRLAFAWAEPATQPPGVVEAPCPDAG